MKNINALIIIVPLVILYSPLAGQKDLYAKQELVADLEYLKIELEQHHSNLYTYSSKEQVDWWFKNQCANLSDSISKEAAFKVVTSISPLLKDGHCYIYPSAQHLASFFSAAPLFPLEVFLSNGSLVVTANYSKEQNIPLGSMITQINHVSVEDIQSLIVGHTCRDGDNLAYPEHLFYKFFPAYYSFFFGFQNQFTIQYLDKDGVEKAVCIQGLTREKIKASRNAEPEVGIDLQFLPDIDAAVLSIKSFDNQMLRADYDQKFKRAIRKTFKLLRDAKIEYLAIDLRDNQGGALSNGIYLLQHFLIAPFQCVDSYYQLKHGKRKQLNTKWDNYFNPKKKYHFGGEVFLFLNGGSFSCSAIVANTFKASKRGQVLGQMSGGSAYVNSGGPNKLVTLPNSKITFTIPKTQYQLSVELSEIGLGVPPDVSVEDTPERILGNKDHYIDKFKGLVERR
ncbi:MAG: S41 family peptidase [Bacteroidota bacterium]